MNYTLSEVREKFIEKKGFNLIRVGECELRSILNNDNEMLYTNAGFYGSDELLNKWKGEYIRAVIDSDVLLDVYSCDSFRITSKLLMNLNIYKNCVPYWEESLSFWVDLCDTIAKHEICVISYFADEMKSQAKNLDKIHNRPTPWKFSFIEAFNSIEGNKPHNDFFETLEIMKKRIDKSTADYFLVSCGCYGILLCDYIKKIGKNSIYVGGQLQLLFGLKGARWDKREGIKKNYNKFWKYPKRKPKNYNNVEGGCYWEDTNGGKDSKKT